MKRMINCSKCKQTEVPVTVINTMGNHYPSPKVTFSPVRYCDESGRPLTDEELKGLNESKPVSSKLEIRTGCFGSVPDSQIPWKSLQ